jgi:hypothetical protein
VQSNRIVPALDEAEAGHSRFGLGCKTTAVEQLAFERGKEALARGVVANCLLNRCFRSTWLPNLASAAGLQKEGRLPRQSTLWQEAMAVTVAAPQSLPAYRFVASLNEMNNIHEKRLTALCYHVPGAVMFMLIGVATVAIGFTGYDAGGRGNPGRVAALIMSLMVAVVVMLIADLDQLARGLVEVSVRPLADARLGIPP